MPYWWLKLWLRFVRFFLYLFIAFVFGNPMFSRLVYDCVLHDYLWLVVWQHLWSAISCQSIYWKIKGLCYWLFTFCHQLFCNMSLMTSTCLRFCFLPQVWFFETFPNFKNKMFVSFVKWPLVLIWMISLTYKKLLGRRKTEFFANLTCW